MWNSRVDNLYLIGFRNIAVPVIDHGDRIHHLNNIILRKQTKFRFVVLFPHREHSEILHFSHVFIHFVGIQIQDGRTVRNAKIFGKFFHIYAQHLGTLSRRKYYSHHLKIQLFASVASSM